MSTAPRETTAAPSLNEEYCRVAKNTLHRLWAQRPWQLPLLRDYWNELPGGIQRQVRTHRTCVTRNSTMRPSGSAIWSEIGRTPGMLGMWDAWSREVTHSWMQDVWRCLGREPPNSFRGGGETWNWWRSRHYRWTRVRVSTDPNPKRSKTTSVTQRELWQLARRKRVTKTSCKQYVWWLDESNDRHMWASVDL